MNHIPVGISSCLLGERVRYDGDHKRDRFISEVLSRYLEYLPCCPEMAIGLGVPRATIHLRASPSGPRAVQGEGCNRDVTPDLATCAAGAATRSIAGYIFKSRSPSCGLRGVPVRDATGRVAARGAGIFAAALRRRLPQLPVEEETGLRDPARRDSFLEQIFVWHCWRRRSVQPGTLGDFHARYGFLAAAHSGAALRDLNAMARDAAGDATAPDRYLLRLLGALQRRIPPARQARSLESFAGRGQRRLCKAIADYGAGRVPVIVPLVELDQMAAVR